MPENSVITCPELTRLYTLRTDHGSKGNGRAHRHSFWELILFESGEGIHTINGIDYPFRSRQLALLAPSDIHRLRPAENTTFDSTKVGFFFNIYSDHLKDICKFDRFPVIVSLNDSDYSKASSLFELLKDEYAAPQLPGTDVFSINILEQLLILVVRNLPEQKHTQTTDSKNSRRILLYIQQHFSEPITISDVASALNYSPKYFGKLFLKQMGVTFQDYLKSLRLNYAYHLIQYSDRSIIDICYETGFSSPTYFSKSFKQKYGFSPNHLRKTDRHD